MHKFRQPLLITVTILFIFAGWLLQTVIGIETRLQSPQYYATAADEIKPGLVTKISRTMTNNHSPLLQQAVAGAVSSTFSAEWFNQQIENILSVEDNSEAVIDFASQKETLTEELTKTFRRRTPQELALMGLSLARVKPVVEELVATLDLPDQITVPELFSLDVQENQQSLQKSQATRSYFRYLTPAGFIILTAAIFLLTRSTLGFKWAGGTMIIAGLTYLPGIFIFKTTAVSALASYLSPFLQNPYTFLEAGVTARALINAATGAFVAISLIYTAIGLLLFLTPSALTLLNNRRRPNIKRAQS